MIDIGSGYEDFFRVAFGFGPFEYQRRLATEPSLPSLVNVPTGAGKTAAVLGAWLWRRIKEPSTVGRRLVYCLPMRTLVEQTWRVAKSAINELAEKELITKDRFTVHVLMGGYVTDQDEWDMHPECECILIGTQDMLLSRALDRGYAMSRFRWPVHFGLLNNDCLWVLDEVQLMSDGLATSVQLAAFREMFGTYGNSQSIWMSATLDRRWLKQIDFKDKVAELDLLELSEADRDSETLAKRLNAKKLISQASTDCRLPQGLAEFVKANHESGTQTLVIVNMVDRAREVYEGLRKAYGLTPAKGKKKDALDLLEDDPSIVPQIELIHSRFRPAERKGWQRLFNEQVDESSAGRIIVATQVIEAGVNISSRLLVTDLAPFASLVQRFGRCNRGGEVEEAKIYWIDRPLVEKKEKLKDKEELDEKELGQIALPYEWRELENAQRLLERLEADYRSASPSALKEIDYDATYNPAHVLRRRDIIDLFDTTTDLSGYDLDISRFVRGGDERDVSVFWRELNGKNPDKSESRAIHDEICAVPIYEIKDFIKNKNAWTWDALMGDWHKAQADELRPGKVVLLDAKEGGYDERCGWDAKSKKPVAVVPRKEEASEENEAYDDDMLTFRPKKFLRLSYYQTLAAHSLEARRAAEQIIAELNMPALEELRSELLKAVQHHDWGKAHKIFQATLHDLPKDADLDGLTMEPLLAKSKSNQKHRRPKFRHELASALALLQTEASDLTVYLAACHHGKVRLSIRTLPGEQKPDGGEESKEIKFARGIWDGDELPETNLGDGMRTTRVTLDLEPMLLGRSETGNPSWLERMIALRDRLGVFRLAYLECLIRAADVRASSNPQDILPDETLEEKNK